MVSSKTVSAGTFISMFSTWSNVSGWKMNRNFVDSLRFIVEATSSDPVQESVPQVGFAEVWVGGLVSFGLSLAVYIKTLFPIVAGGDRYRFL